jgi:hypothetical protein
LDEIGWTGSVDEFNQVARLKDRSVLEPILITPNGIVLAGFGLLRLAILEGRQETPCFEYPITDDAACSSLSLTIDRSGDGTTSSGFAWRSDKSPTFSKKRSKTCVREANTRV